MDRKEDSFVMKIMYKAVEATVAKGFGGRADYENPEFRMMMASSAGAPLRSMQISGGMKGGLMQGLLDMANGHFLRGIKKMIIGRRGRKNSNCLLSNVPAYDKIICVDLLFVAI